MTNSISLRKVLAFGFLKLVIEYRNRRYIILRCVRSGEYPDRGMLSLPYVTKTIPTNWPFSLDRNEIARRLAGMNEDLNGNKIELQKRMVALCHQLGFHSFTVDAVTDRKAEHFLSGRSGIVGISVLFNLRLQAGFPRHALSDMHGRRGFTFIPLDSVDRLGDRLEVYENTRQTLLDLTDADRLIDLKDDDFLMPLSGHIYSLDINGYGRLLHKSQGNALSSKGVVQNLIRNEVIRMTSVMLLHLGLPAHQTTGDGAIFCIPTGGAIPAEVFKAYLEDVCQPLEGINNMIRAGQSSGELAGSRLIVIADDFHVGRVAGADSTVSGIGGQSLIDAVRLDSGFKEHLVSTGVTGAGKHYLVSNTTVEHASILYNAVSKLFEYKTKEGAVQNGRYSICAL